MAHLKRIRPKRCRKSKENIWEICVRGCQLMFLKHLLNYPSVQFNMLRMGYTLICSSCNAVAQKDNFQNYLGIQCVFIDHLQYCIPYPFPRCYLLNVNFSVLISYQNMFNQAGELLAMNYSKTFPFPTNKFDGQPVTML